MDSVLAAFLLPQREVRARRAARQRPPGFNLVQFPLLLLYSLKYGVQPLVSLQFSSKCSSIELKKDAI